MAERLERIRAVLGRAASRLGLRRPASSGYRLGVDLREQADGWQRPTAARRQHQAYRRLLADVERGRPRLDFEVAAKAVRETGLAAPSVLEIGCGSGYYGPALALLVGQGLRYVGVDYSPPMIALATKAFPELPFFVGDARALPVRDRAVDIGFSGVSLMHIPEYRLAIRETVRISRAWCIFHTVPVRYEGETVVYGKQAYGAPVTEVVFNHAALIAELVAAGLEVVSEQESIPYDLQHVLGEPTKTVTLLCRRTQGGQEDPGTENGR